MTNWRIRFERPITAVFRLWWRVQRPMTLGVRGVACDAQGCVLLVRHSYLAGWHLPGGGVERGEHAPAAIAREMAEEGGVQPISPPRIFALYSNHDNYANDHIALYRIETWRPCAPLASQEIAERGFFDPASPPPDTTKATLRRLDEVFGGAPIPTHW